MLHLLEQEDGAAREDGLGARRHDRRDEARQLANPNDVIEAPAANENPYGETLVHWATLGLSAFPLPLNLVDFQLCVLAANRSRMLAFARKVSGAPRCPTIGDIERQIKNIEHDVSHLKTHG